MPIARFQMEDGRVARFEVPDGTTPEQAQQMMVRHFAQPQSEPAQPAEATDSQQTGGLMGWNRRMGQAIANAGAGAIRGAGSIGATLLSPLDIAKDAIAGKGLSLESNRARRAAMDQGLQDMGADTESLAYGGGKLAGEIAGTAGVGGMLGRGVGLVSQSPKALALAEALRTGGMSAGGAGMGTRMAGGALSGGAMAGAINPEDAPTGAMFGGALPVAVKGAGMVGSKIASKMQVGSDRAQLAQKAASLGIDIPADRIANSRILNAGAASLDYVPFSGRIETETRMNNQIKKALSNTFGENSDSLSKDLFSKAQNKLGQGFDDFLTKNNLVVDQQLKSELYKKLELAKREMGNDARFKSLKNQVDDLFGKAYSQPVQSASQSMDDISRMNAVRQTHPDTIYDPVPVDFPMDRPKDLLGAIRKLGGVSMKDAKDLLGERQITKMGVQGGVFTTKGEEVGDMVRRLVDKGVMPRQVLSDVDGGAQALRDAIQKSASGGGDEVAQRAAAEAYYGAPEVLPGAFKEGVNSAPESLPFEKSNTIYGVAAYDTKKVLDRMSSSADTSLSHHAKEIRNSIMDGVLRSAPADESAAFTALKRNYANLKSLQKLAGNSAEGDISMARLGNIDSRNQEVLDLAKIAATFAKGRESPHGAMQRVAMGSGVAALGGGALAGVAAPIAAGLTAGRAANMALNSKTLKALMLGQPVTENSIQGLLSDPTIRAGLLSVQSR